jgi:subtilisin family serine protease
MDKKTQTCFFLICLALVLCPVFPGHTASDCPDLDITADNRMISIHVKDAPIDCVLAQISRRTCISVKLWQNDPTLITLSLTDVSVDEFFTKLGMGNALVYTHVPETDEYRLIAVDLAARTKGRAPLPDTSVPEEKISGQADPADPHTRPGELLVQFKDHVPMDQMHDLHRFLGSTILKTLPRLNLFQVQFDPLLSRDTAIRMYLASGLVKTAEPHYLRTRQQMIPNDPKFADQWGLTAIQAPKAWEISQGSPDIIIAVIDTGVNYDHPDLTDNIWINPAEAFGQAGVDDDGNGYVDDIHGRDFADSDNDPSDISGHGTHVAGIIGARTDNAMDVAGVCPNVKIMVLKVEADAGGDMESIHIIEAIDYATFHGATILNCSFGGTDYQDAENLALKHFAESNDGLIICSAGNAGKDIDKWPLYPASYDLPEIISVAASRQDSPGNYVLADFSNHGQTSVDLMAPGDNIVSLRPVSPEPDLSSPTRYMTGTSMATAFVSGAAGLLRSHAPQITADEIKTILLNTIDPILPPPDKPDRQILTNGHLNIFKALATLPLPGDMNKNYQLRIPDTFTVLQILSGQTAEYISPDITHWDADGDETAGLPEAINVLQNENRFQ